MGAAVSLPWRPGVGVGLAVTVACLGIAACGSGSGSATPQGLKGSEVGTSANSAYAAENAAAATSLTPSAGSFLAGKSTVSVLGSTTPGNGDINPYAIWPVTQTTGSVKAGDVLVDNFNNASNDQGTGTTIVDLHPDGQLSVFAQLPQAIAGCPGGVGLTTAMVQLKTGWVIVGSLPSTNGKIGTAGAGCLIEVSAGGQAGGHDLRGVPRRAVGRRRQRQRHGAVLPVECCPLSPIDESHSSGREAIAATQPNAHWVSGPSCERRRIRGPKRPGMALSPLLSP